MSVRQIRFLLTTVSFAYLALPVTIFLLGWLRAPFGIAGALLTVIGVIAVGRHSWQSCIQSSDESSVGAVHLVSIAGVAALLVLLGGIGGIGPQTADWFKHMAIFKELVVKPWPIYVSIPGIKLPLVYYVAFYLPAALIGKVAGWWGGSIFLAFWGWIGISLAMAWFALLSGRFSLIAIALFVFFSGLDPLGLVSGHLIDDTMTAGWRNMDEWSYPWQYSAHLTQLFWIPNQAIAGWLAAALVLGCGMELGGIAALAFLLVLLPFWSPFVAIGLLPFIIRSVFTPRRQVLPLTGRRFFNVALYGASGFLLLTSLVYFGSRHEGGAIRSGWVWDQPGFLGYIWLFALFLLLEIGIYLLLLVQEKQSLDRFFPGMFAVSGGTLFLIPWYHMGYFNDFAMRASIPALFVLAVLIGRRLVARPLTFPVKVLVTLLIVGGLNPIAQAVSQLDVAAKKSGFFQRQTLEQTPGFTEFILETVKGDPKFASVLFQYSGDPNSLFFRALSRK